MGIIKDKNASFLAVNISGAEERIPDVYGMLCHDECANNVYTAIQRALISKWGS